MSEALRRMTERFFAKTDEICNGNLILACPGTAHIKYSLSRWSAVKGYIILCFYIQEQQQHLFLKQNGLLDTFLARRVVS